MKIITLLSSIFFIQNTLAQDITLQDNKFELVDIARFGVSKETVFENLNTRFIKASSSICSNRALVWAYDIKRKHGVNSAKIFLFYTKKSGEVGRKTWWYHVAPVVNENNELWVVDKGFSGFIKAPLRPTEWLSRFTGSTNCKEIQLGEDDLINRMFTPQTFPEVTSYGSYDCYYRVMPEGYWTPASVAKNMLKRDQNGRSVSFEQNEINESELMVACEEASTSKVGRVFTSAKEKCKEYLGL